jgi:hypothetical protein
MGIRVKNISDIEKRVIIRVVLFLKINREGHESLTIKAQWSIANGGQNSINLLDFNNKISIKKEMIKRATVSAFCLRPDVKFNRIEKK